ncbi:MAG: ABC transporter ATP-binding protein [Saprospiraceae bacterium]
MSNIVIKANGLGKKYLISHQTEREGYTALRDVLARQARSIVSKTQNLFSGQQLLIGDKIEEFWALKDLDFEIRQGDRVGIIGRNGAGKSTLLKVLSRITEPSTGRAEIHGRVASLLEVGTGFHPELTGRENTYLNGAILGMSRSEIKKKFDEIVEFAGVEKFLDTPVKRYSSGMYVRLAFAVAAHLEPEILVVDEVLAVGDAAFQKKCLGKMEDVSNKDGRTVIFVSHNMNAMSSLCNKGILLDHGEIKHKGSIQSTIVEYLNQYTKTNRKVSYSLEKAPSGDGIKFLSAEVRPVDSTREIDYFEAGDSIELEFIFQNLNPGQNNLDVTFHLLDEMGNLVFVGSTGFQNKEPKRYAPGKIKFICRIPSGLMNEGVYNIYRFLVVQDRGTVLFEDRDVLQFEIIGKQEENWGWMGKKEGIVRPVLEWIG